jgi:hypothetical protein
MVYAVTALTSAISVTELLATRIPGCLMDDDLLVPPTSECSHLCCYGIPPPCAKSSSGKLGLRFRSIKILSEVASIRKGPHATISADSDEVARAFRDDVGRDSEMMSPGVRCLAGG